MTPDHVTLPLPDLNSWMIRRLEFYFAMLTVLGGCVLAVGNDGAMIPVIAIFFAIVGYVFVDLLKIIALPATAAYIAMALAAVFCIADFIDGDAVGPRQLLAVAHLLVLVQAILMMQRKTKRIFEQLAIFCLLELIVAAVFNDALVFGLLLVPMVAIGALALGLMSSATAMDGFPRDDEQVLGPMESTSIRTIAGESTRAAMVFANRYSSIPVLSLTPAAMIVAGVFFYVLPRTTESSRPNRRGQALVGFQDMVYLKQFGQMLQNPDIALRVRLSDRITGAPYRAREGVYLRGRVLEQYKVVDVEDQNTAIWQAIPLDPEFGARTLPPEYVPARPTDLHFFDKVKVSIDCESLRSNSLFVIAPYYRLGFDREIINLGDRWTICRRGGGDWVRPPIKYEFGTNAFRESVQTELIARASATAEFFQTQAEYADALLSFDRTRMPTVARIADRLSQETSEKRLSDHAIAKALENHFFDPSLYAYSLDLRSETDASVDPIERFVAIDRKGHCQYFASALAMMLRSQKIPARIVVGYHTGEYNQWANQYVARELHAHAWVEALIHRDQIDQPPKVYGQPDADQYWLRLDPTPSQSQSNQESGLVRQGIDIAQELWEDNVIDMDSERQQATAITGGLRPAGQWYEGAAGWLGRQIRRLKSGFLAGRSLATSEFFSWSTALIWVAGLAGLVALARSRLSNWIRRQPADLNQASPRPGIAFYAQALDQLERIGIRRQPAQTPEEFVGVAAAQVAIEGLVSIRGPMERLTTTFYRQRFGGRQLSADDRVNEYITADLASIAASVEAIVRQRSSQPTKAEQDRIATKE